ncbi:MAG: tetratricopeptide repeat protein [Ferruginibacter sp.]|nr:tetratricopeptide repeat protein [Cytophagales bacterium]
MKPFVRLWFSFLLAGSGALFAQRNALPDSIDARLEKSVALTFSQPDQALALAEAALALSRKQGYKFQAAKAYQAISRIYGVKGNYASALEASHSALVIFQELNKPRETCLIYISQGVIYRYLNLYDESIAANLAAEKLAQQQHYTELKSKIYGNLGNVYFDKEDYDQALKNHLQSLEIDQAQKNERGMGSTYHNIGMIYRTRKEFARALELYQKSLAIDRKENNQQNIGLSYVEFTEIYLEMGNFPRALRYADSALAIAESIGSQRLKKNALANLPLIHAALGRTGQALQYQQQYQQLTDSLQSAKLSEQIAEMQARYQVEQKDKALSLQHLRLEAQQASLQQQRTLGLGLVVFFLSGGVIAFLFFNRYKLQQKNLKLSLENERYRLSQNLQFRQDIDDTIHYFATSLYGKNTVDEILWDVAKNCISRLGFVDCVIYLLEDEPPVLVQKAAFGTKNPRDYAILEPLVIPLGQGIVGSVALSGKAERIADTSLDARYLVDDQRRFSELAVPLVLRDKVIGVIDSEHPAKGFFNERHQEALQTIAAICSGKIARVRADEEVRKATLAQLEADHLKKMDGIKSRFFANISHEFRTPLHLILAPLQKKGEAISPEERGMMERNAHRLLRLVNQLLDLAKAEVGMLQLDLQQEDITHFLHHLAHSFKPLADNKGIRYRIDVPHRELIVGFDADKLEKIGYNLLSNAIKFTPSGGEVTVQAIIESDDRLRLVVSDSGPGVPQHLQPQIFDRFYQVDSSPTRAFEGTGIGLALTKELVELCQGSISLNSPSGNGSSFVVHLPLTAADPAHAGQPFAETVTRLPLNDPGWVAGQVGVAPTDDADDDAKPTVLLVEDHPELRHYLKQQLAGAFQVVLATQGEEGLQVAKKIVPDLIITDLMMPVMDGITLTRHLKEDSLTSHIPVLMLTAKDDVASKKRGFEEGAEQYLVKPFVIGELVARINSLLTQRNRLRIKYSREVILQPTAVTIPDREAEFLEKTMAIINEHLMDDRFTVETLQKKIGMSRMQLHRKLKALTDQSTSDFIRFIRLKRAADLLRQPGMPVAEAAYLSGFSHLSYFSKCFKDQFGVLPSDYAKQVESN